MYFDPSTVKAEKNLVNSIQPSVTLLSLFSHNIERSVEIATFRHTRSRTT